MLEKEYSYPLYFSLNDVLSKLGRTDLDFLKNDLFLGNKNRNYHHFDMNKKILNAKNFNVFISSFTEEQDFEKFVNSINNPVWLYFYDESKKSFFCSEYEKQRAEANKYYNGLKDKRKATKYLNIFFFGFPDENDRFLFKTDYFKLVYILFLGKFEISYNDTNYIIENEKEPALVMNNSFSSFDIRGIGNTDNVDDSFDLIDNILPEPEPEPEPEPVAKESNILLKGIGAVLKFPIIIMNIWRH